MSHAILEFCDWVCFWLSLVLPLVVFAFGWGCVCHGKFPKGKHPKGEGKTHGS